MSNLIVIGFNNEADAFSMRAELAKLQTQYLIEMEDAVEGARLQREATTSSGSEPHSGRCHWGECFWGTLIGMLFLNPLLGAAEGALSGKLSVRP